MMPLEGRVFVGCTECGLEWPLEDGERIERHRPTCSRVDEMLAEADRDG